jgi:hypothetical protein
MTIEPTQPLPPIDANGIKLTVGMRVRILVIPHWLTHDLPSEDIARLKNVEGTVMQIAEIDAFGYVWFGDWFSLKPYEVAFERDMN